MYMRDWLKKLDAFLELNDKEILTNAGKVSRDVMEVKVKEELAKYNKAQKLADRSTPALPEGDTTQ